MSSETKSKRENLESHLDEDQPELSSSSPLSTCKKFRQHQLGSGDELDRRQRFSSASEGYKVATSTTDYSGCRKINSPDDGTLQTTQINQTNRGNVLESELEIDPDCELKGKERIVGGFSRKIHLSSLKKNVRVIRSFGGVQSCLGEEHQQVKVRAEKRRGEREEGCFRRSECSIKGGANGQTVKVRHSQATVKAIDVNIAEANLTNRKEQQRSLTDESYHHVSEFVGKSVRKPPVKLEDCRERKSVLNIRGYSKNKENDDKQQYRKQTFSASSLEGNKNELSTSTVNMEASANRASANETSKVVTKKTIATYIEKDVWKTNHFIVDESSYEQDTQMTEIEGKFGTSWEEEEEKDGQLEEPVARNEIIVQGLIKGGKKQSKGYLLDCAAAAVMANLKTLEQQSCGSLIVKATKQKDKSQETRPDYSDDYDNYRSLSSGFEAPSGMSKLKLTKSSTSSANQSAPIHISIDNLRMIVEKNLVATLIGIYILVSLTVIMVLILPYLYLPRSITIDNSGEELLTNPFERIHKVTDSLIDKVERKEQFSNTESKTTQTEPVDETSPQSIEAKTVKTSQQVVEKAIISPSSSSTTRKKHEEEQQNNIGNSFGSDNYNKQPVADSDDFNRHRQEQAHGQQSRKRGARVSPLKSDEVAPSTSHSSGKEIKDKFNGLWSVAHNQACQLLKVPFCSKSYGPMFSSQQVATSGGQQQVLSQIPYDSTLLPNQFTSTRQSQVERVLQRYEPIIDIKCYALMPLFLCSIYAPKCIKLNRTQVERHFVRQNNNSAELLNDANDSEGENEDQDEEGLYFADQLAMAIKKPTPVARIKPKAENQQTKSTDSDNWSRLVPPCRSLCKETFRKCMFFFEVLSLKLIDPEDCDSLPESSNPNVCVGQQEYNFVKRTVEVQSCQDDKFRCGDGSCIPKKWRCDGFADCTDKSDEEKAACSKCNPKSQFYCGQDICVAKDQVCNGIIDCKDGRDERQCLRLTQTKEGQHKIGEGRLEVWSATHESWVPVCGTHWRPMPMSHEACQALGYSRANKTQILFNPLPESKIKHEKSPTSPARALMGSSTTRAPHNASRNSVSAYNESSRATTNDSIGFSARSPLAWFEFNPADSYTSSADLSTSATDNEELAGVVEDMATSVEIVTPANRLNRAGKVDHLIVYERSSSTMSVSKPATNYGTKSVPNERSTNDRTTDLSAINAAEVKFRSLTSMLYHGPSSGCVGKEDDLISSVHLKCQNFQCGRPITSYTSRLQQQQALVGETKRAPLTAAFRSPIVRVETKHVSSRDDYTDTNGNNNKRVKVLKATEELELEQQTDGLDKVEENLLIDKIIKDSSRSLIEELNQHSISSRLVVGGTESMPGEFPYLAALHGGPDEVFFCGGVLISVNWLLTAAHCVGNRTQPDGWMVKVGVTRRIASPSFVKKLKVRKIIKHQRFNFDSPFNNDIALLLLEESVEFNQYLRPICLPKANLILGPDNSKQCVVVGFGKSKFSSEANYLHVAHWVNVPIVKHSICSNWYSEYSVHLQPESMLCAGYAEGKRDACQGDSGSGLFCRYSSANDNLGWFVAGLVSFGIKCATPKLPGVYTSVSHYVDWIELTTRQHGYPLAGTF